MTDSTGLDENEFLRIVEEACKGGVTLVQLREKERSGKDLLDLALKVKAITSRYGIPLIIDDRIDIAIAADADGVHLGQSDVPVHAARKILGKNKIIGASAKTVAQSETARDQGADYLGVGAIRPTTTKVVTVITSVETLNDISSASGLPVVAIGGLNASNLHLLYESDADGIAVVSAIMKSDDPRNTAKALKEQVQNNFKKHRS